MLVMGSARLRGERVTLWHCPKVTKRLGALGGGRTNVVFVPLPCDARRMAAAPNSHIPVLKQSALSPPFCCASRHRQRRQILLRWRPSMASREAKPNGCLASAARRKRARRGPCAAVRSGRSGPQGGCNGLCPLAAAPRMARRQARPDRTRLSSMDGRKAQHRGGLLFGGFLLATQGKVTRPPGRRAEKDRDVGSQHSAIKIGPGSHPLRGLVRNDDILGPRTSAR
jgi:hypothetical protein